MDEDLLNEFKPGNMAHFLMMEESPAMREFMRRGDLTRKGGRTTPPFGTSKPQKRVLTRNIYG
jgi:hypothetical protein